MRLLSVENVSKYFSSDPVLDQASLEVYAGQHIGLVGPNGAGKTTLLNILADDLAYDAGEIKFTPGTRVGFLRQRESIAPTQTVWQLAQTAMKPLIQLVESSQRIAAAMATCGDSQRSELERKYDTIHGELERRGGYQIDFKIRRILEGLGFAAEMEQRPISELSGGQQNRLLLARLLLEDPELMLLDEPSNHLDIESTQWLENFLAESAQAFILVSHDRYFLDRVTSHTLELVQGKIDTYPGNYTKYKSLKGERLEIERRTYQRQTEEVEKLKDFIRRHHHGQKHAQAEDRRRKLERITLVPPPREIAVPAMKFHDATRTGDIVVRVERLSKGFGQPLFRNVSFQIERGQRWGMIGPNGCGKTTLLNCLLGTLESDEGSVKLGTAVEVGFFDQHLECVDNDSISAEAIRPRDESTEALRMDEQQRRDLLARFGITGETALQAVSSLSGGQRNRVALANLAAQRANFLILDEPTNHLDLWAREALEQALLEFSGTVLLVSHDRYFLNRVCDHLLIVEPVARQTSQPDASDAINRVVVIEGNYDTYRMLIQDSNDQPASPTRLQATPDPTQAKQQTTAKHGMDIPGNATPNLTRGKTEPAKRRRQFPYRKLADIEADIVECENETDRMHQLLINPAVLRDGKKIKQTKQRMQELQLRLEQLMQHWEETSELN